MTILDDDDMDVVLPVPINRQAREWLVEVARDTGCDPGMIVASILHDVITDDLRAHAFH